MRSVGAREANHQFASLLNQVEAGETVVITRHGKPIARIIPERRPASATGNPIANLIQDFASPVGVMPIQRDDLYRRGGDA